MSRLLAALWHYHKVETNVRSEEAAMQETDTSTTKEVSNNGQSVERTNKSGLNVIVNKDEIRGTEKKLQKLLQKLQMKLLQGRPDPLGIRV